MLSVLRAAACTALAAAALAACGSPAPTPVSDSCTSSTTTIVTALRTAPRDVALPDGTRLSDCIRNALDEGELQDVGLTFSQAAERLRTRALGGDHAAALQLGYLVGAVRSGAKRTQGVMAELQRRIELVGGRLIDERPTLDATLQRGLAAGESGG